MSCTLLSGPAQARLLVLGEAPFPGEEEPFTSKHGTWFRSALEQAGISTQKLTFSYLISSTPVAEMTEISPALDYRAPTDAEVRAEHAEREARIAGVDPSFILLTGDVPLRTYRPDLNTLRAHGRPFCRKPYHFDDSVIYFPVFHPAAVMRNPEWVPTLQRDLSRLLVIGGDRENWDLYAPSTCVECDSPEANRVDPYLIPYCEQHFLTRTFPPRHI